MRISSVVWPLACAVLLGAASIAGAETRLSVDASGAVPAPETGYLITGSNKSPSGQTIEINSQYLARDGKPWLPVMGEIHYTRIPADYWDEELAKMQAAGVEIISFYVIWQHHEERAGQFDWKGDRDVRRFVELCAKHKLYVVLRPGPWAHSEVRFGGIPDWVVTAMPTRSSDPTYLSYVGRFFDETAKQVRGLLWKDGGPIIGIQLENEYNRTGPLEGRQHVADLKALALKAGFDVPLYTVTAWDNAIFPAREVMPMFGSYPDMPWATSPLKLPPNEAYAFRFETRVTGDLNPKVFAATAMGDADKVAAHTPFLSAEYAGGLPSMYRRRTVLSSDDVASLLTIQIGSGVNLYGYYMFHGGRNPPGLPTREENTGIGGYNDLPLIGYDFQSPLGEYGQQHAVMSKIRPMHLFLQSFGNDLATMAPRKPDRVSRAVDDVSTPRFSVRSNGDSGFLFVSNYLRLYPMDLQKAVRFSVKLPAGTLDFPAKPVDIASGAYFVWPINMNLDGARLAYATAQPVTRVDTDAGPLYVFRSVDGIPAEFAFDSKTTTSVKSASGRVAAANADGRIVVSAVAPGTKVAVTAKTSAGKSVRVLVLTEAQAERLWLVPFQGRDRLVMTDDQLFLDGDTLELRSKGDTDFNFGVFPALAATPGANLAVRARGNDGIFQLFESHAVARNTEVKIARLRDAQAMPPIAIGGSAQAALQPAPELFGKSAAWTLTVPADVLENVNDAYLQIDYRGDVVRLFSGVELIDDAYYNGLTWEIGLKRFTRKLKQPFTLTVLPLRKDAPIYIEDEFTPDFAANTQIADLVSVKVASEYRLQLR